MSHQPSKSNEEIVEEFFKYDLIPIQVELENPHYWKGYKDTCDIIKTKLLTTLEAKDAERERAVGEAIKFEMKLLETHVNRIVEDKIWTNSIYNYIDGRLQALTPNISNNN